MTAMHAAETGAKLLSSRDHLYLHLKGGTSTPTVYLSITGTKTSGRIYLGAYTHERGGYMGSADGRRLLRWLESAARPYYLQVREMPRGARP